jgi:methyltransferase family protein
MALDNRAKRFLVQNPLGRILLMPFRFAIAFGHHAPKLKHILSWTLLSRETTNFTYEITSKNQEYLAHTVSVVTGVPFPVAAGYIREIQDDESARRHVIDRVRKGPKRSASDETCAFGRRVGWYAFARILKPRVVVETGVDKGLGSVVLCAALMRNQAEGFPGQYFGTDINPDAGFLLAEPYNSVGRILYGDSIQSLQNIPSIDFFVNDSDHSSEYERREYETIASKLSEDGVILGDNCHCNDVLADFSAKRGRQFVFFREEPKDHWYPGGGIGISFIKDSFPSNQLSNRRFASGEPISQFHAGGFDSDTSRMPVVAGRSKA